MVCRREGIEKGQAQRSSYLHQFAKVGCRARFLSVPFVCAESAVRCVLCSEGGCSMCTIARQGALCGWELRCDAMRCDATNETTEQSRALQSIAGLHPRVSSVLENAILRPFSTIMNQSPGRWTQPLAETITSPTPELIFQPPPVGCQPHPHPPNFAFTPATSATQKLLPSPLLAPDVASRSPAAGIVRERGFHRRRGIGRRGRDVFDATGRSWSGYAPIMTLLLSVGKRVSSFIFCVVAQGGW
ncbi:hypothetical protein EDB80DRAFT_72985 [Ilyonectria destructans]|nr:hypothetical protein EDB80DRAFT_72985 [Ilyonectria destructans]